MFVSTTDDSPNELRLARKLDVTATCIKALLVNGVSTLFIDNKQG